jgi:hypothetical protein
MMPLCVCVFSTLCNTCTHACAIHAHVNHDLHGSVWTCSRLAFDTLPAPLTVSSEPVCAWTWMFGCNEGMSQYERYELVWMFGMSE